MNDSAHTPVQTDQNVTAYMYLHARLLDKYKTLFNPQQLQASLVPLPKDY